MTASQSQMIKRPHHHSTLSSWVTLPLQVTSSSCFFCLQTHLSKSFTNLVPSFLWQEMINKSKHSYTRKYDKSYLKGENTQINTKEQRTFTRTHCSELCTTQKHEAFKCTYAHYTHIHYLSVGDKNQAIMPGETKILDGLAQHATMTVENLPFIVYSYMPLEFVPYPYTA